jgi:serine/threonine-protein kinase
MADAFAATPPGGRSAGATAESHAAELAAGAVPRLRILAIVFFAMLSLMLIAVHLIGTDVIHIREARSVAINNESLIAALIGSLALICATFTRWSPRRILLLGTIYQIYGAFCIAYLEQSGPSGAGVPVVCIWILSFTLVPTGPPRAAIAAWAAAATEPASFLLHYQLGTRAWPDDASTALGFVVTAVSAAIAILIARVIYGLGRQVADARKLGAYVLIDQLGHGGMGEVWRAEHNSLIRPAAIKLLRRELSAHLSGADLAALNKRFYREVQATALLSSPHTVAIYDFGQTVDGALYYVMELLSGFDAETLVTRYGPQPPERVVHLLRQACESLAEAHHRGLIHRDVKPANLHICAIGMELDFVKLLDFGLVHNVERDERLTRDGSISGTPAYLAPESAAHAHFDPRSDLYSLGCVAYWLLTGTTVFSGDTSVAVLAAHIRDEPEPPSRRTEIAIPKQLEDVILACLAKDPDARPQSAEELSRLLAAVPLAAWTPERAAAWWRAHVPDILAAARSSCHGAVERQTARDRPKPVIKERGLRAAS